MNLPEESLRTRSNSKQTPCANLTVKGCTNSVTQRGNILCEPCKEEMKKNRQEQNSLEELSRLTEIIRKLETSLKLSQEKNLKTMRELDDQTGYSKQLEKENTKLIEVTLRLRKEIEELVKEKCQYDMSYSQIKLDSKKLLVEIERLKKINDELKMRQPG